MAMTNGDQTSLSLAGSVFLRFYAYHSRRGLSYGEAWHAASGELIVWFALAVLAVIDSGATILGFDLPSLREYRTSHVLVLATILLVLVASPLNPFRIYRDKTELISKYSSASHCRQVWWFRLVAILVVIVSAVAARHFRQGI